MKKLLTLMLGSVAFLGLANQPTSSQEDTLAIRTAMVSVTDEKGMFMSGLGDEDFQISERGTARDVVNVVEVARNADLYLLVDTSIAFRGQVGRLRGALESFVGAIAGGYQVRVIEFGGRVRSVAGPTNDRHALMRAVSGLTARSEGAYLLDAIAATAREISVTEREEGKKPVVVILTGLGPEFSGVHYQRAEKVGKDSGAIFHAIMFAGFAQVSREVEEALQELTKESGGELNRLLSATALKNSLNRLASDHLQSRYRVSFLTELSPKTDEDDLTISVDTPGGEATILKLLPGEEQVEVSSS